MEPGDWDLSKHSSHSPPPFSQLYSLAYNIFVEWRHFSHSNCSASSSLFYTSPTGKKESHGTNLIPKCDFFSGLFDICRDLTILTWSWPFPWASLERDTPPMQPDLQQRRTIRNTGKNQSLYIYSNTFQGGETQTHLRTACNTWSTNKVIPATCWSKSQTHTFFTHRGYTVISLQLPHQPTNRPRTQATRLLQKAPWPIFCSRSGTLRNVHTHQCFQDWMQPLQAGEARLSSRE